MKHSCFCTKFNTWAEADVLKNEFESLDRQIRQLKWMFEVEHSHFAFLSFDFEIFFWLSSVFMETF